MAAGYFFVNFCLEDESESWGLDYPIYKHRYLVFKNKTFWAFSATNFCGNFKSFNFC